MMNENQFITKEGLEKLKKELQELKIVNRLEIAAKIEKAKEMGDLSENAEYHEAKEQQAFIEGRILHLETLINNAIIIEESLRQEDVVSVGSRIKVKTDSQEQEFEIVGVDEADPTGGRISNESPLGQAFLGKRVGDKIDVNIPQGIIKYTILEIK